MYVFDIVNSSVWILLIFSSYLLQQYKQNFLFNVLIVLYLVFMLYLPEVADTYNYKEALVGGIYRGDYLFEILQTFFKYLYNDPVFVIHAIQIFIVALSIFILPIHNRASILLILFSIPIFLSIQNGMRQGIASLFILYFIGRGYNPRSLIAVFIGQLVHKSTILFFLYFSALFWIAKYTGFIVSLLSGLCASIVLFYLIKYTSYNAYLRDGNFADITRVSAELKAVIIVIDAAIIYYYTKGTRSNSIHRLRVLSVSLSGFMLGVAYFYSADEIASRVMFFYFFVTTYLIICYRNYYPFKCKYLLFYNFIRTALSINIHVILAL